jgi:hypothetical protein
MTPTTTFASLSCIVIACGGGCFESKSKPQPAPVVVPLEKAVEAPLEARAPNVGEQPAVAQAADEAR